MIYLSEPIWIWVSAGIIIPILIHLARGHAGKTLRIGSIFFLKENIISQASSLKIRELLLLILRCLGILLTALFLSSPVWKHPFLSGNKKGWVLMEKLNPQQSLASAQPRIDSLLKAGYELHLLDKDFPKARMNEILNSSDSSASLPPYWRLLQQLQQQVPADMPVYVFSGNKLSRFHGNRPELSINLHWIFVGEPDTVAKWVSAVYSTTRDSIRMLTGNSRATGTWYQRTIKLFDYGEAADQVNPDTGELVVSIYSKPGSPDGGFVQAAMEAIRTYSHHRMAIYTTAIRDSVKRNADWICWLSDSAMPVSLHPKNLFTYKAGHPVKTYSRIYPVAVNEPDPAAVSQIVGSVEDSIGGVVWKDGYGRPLLMRNKSDTNVYTFFSRFDPAWNELPWSAPFPSFFLNLLYPATSTDKDRMHDLRVISPIQALPDMHAGGERDSAIKFQSTDLSGFCWFFLFIVFCLERFISWKKKELFRV